MWSISIPRVPKEAEVPFALAPACLGDIFISNPPPPNIQPPAILNIFESYVIYHNEECLLSGGWKGLIQGGGDYRVYSGRREWIPMVVLLNHLEHNKSNCGTYMSYSLNSLMGHYIGYFCSGY